MMRGTNSSNNSDNDHESTLLSSAEAAEVVSSTSSSSSSSWWVIVFSSLWKLFQFCNIIIMFLLIGSVIYLFHQIQYLSYRLSVEEESIQELKIQVQEKQEGQIQELNHAVQEEHNFTVTTVAGTFTLLTCLISMFHMSSHVRNYSEPFVQRKIVAILWMSPIYSITSFISLLWPSSEGYLAIIKDFYEAYCIYTFLSFLIAVLGRGDRNVVVDVLAKHAHHLDRPTRCLNRFYHPPPETNDHALANSVLMECQILCLQFVFIRPITSILNFVSLFIQQQQELHELQEELMDNTTSTSTTMSTLGDDCHDGSGSSSSGGDGSHRYLDYLDDPSTSLYDVPTNSSSIGDTIATTITNSTYFGGGSGDGGDDGIGLLDASNTTSGVGGDFQQQTVAYFTSPGFVFAMIVNVSVFFAFTGLLKFYHAASDDLKWINPFPKFLTIKGVVFLTFWQGLAISIVVNLNSQNETTSPWNDEPQNPTERAAQLQNVLICLEMLFFSITHWCVFPAEEWEPNYSPKVVAKPGIGISDFVSDVSHIVQAGNTDRREGRIIRQRRRRRLRDGGGGGGSPRRGRFGFRRRTGPDYLETVPTTSAPQSDDDDYVDTGDEEYGNSTGGETTGDEMDQRYYKNSVEEDNDVRFSRRSTQKQQQQQQILEEDDMMNNDVTNYDDVDIGLTRNLPELQ